MTFTSITSAQRIRELNAISAEFASILQHASDALHALSHHTDNAEDDVDARKATFEESSRAFFTGVQSGTARLRRQVYALDEAGIIAAEAPTWSSQRPQLPNGAPGRGEAQLEPERITNGGLGNLDVGWLNSRGNKVGAEKEAELMEEAKELARKVLREKREGT